MKSDVDLRNGNDGDNGFVRLFEAVLKGGNCSWGK